MVINRLQDTLLRSTQLRFRPNEEGLIQFRCGAVVDLSELEPCTYTGVHMGRRSWPPVGAGRAMYIRVHNDFGLEYGAYRQPAGMIEHGEAMSGVLSHPPTSIAIASPDPSLKKHFDSNKNETVFFFDRWRKARSQSQQLKKLFFTTLFHA
jgi:hypothetical protein